MSSIKDEAVQHTICQIAFTALTITFQTFNIQGTGEFFDCITKIIYYTKLCQQEINNRRHLSAVAKKKLKNVSNILKNQFTDRSSIDAGHRLYAMFIASTILTFDCKVVAPLWFTGDNCNNLYIATERLSELITDIKAHEDGTELYIKLAY